MMLLKSLGSKKNDPKLLITHRFKVDRNFDAYKTFGLRPTTSWAEVGVKRCGLFGLKGLYCSGKTPFSD